MTPVPEVCPVTGIPTTLRLGRLKVFVDDALPDNTHVPVGEETIVVARNIYTALQREVASLAEAERSRE